MILILYFGNLGTTEKAAHLLGDGLNACEIMNGKKIKKVDFSIYSRIVFGVNVRIGKLNKKFLKFYKKFKKLNLNIPQSGYVIAGDVHQSPTYMNMLATLLPEEAYIRYFGGEFNVTQAKGITKKILQNCIFEFNEKNLPLPQIDQEAILEFQKYLKQIEEELYKN